MTVTDEQQQTAAEQGVSRRVDLHGLVERLGDMEELDRLTGPLSEAVKKYVPAGPLKDALSGTWLGHPLHPLLTDIPIGAFVSATALDLIGGPAAAPAADTLVALGIAFALPTIAAGAADWSDTYGPDMRIGVVHALANVVGVGAYAMSLLARRTGHRGTGTVLGLAGLATMTAGGYIGGYLSYSRGVGVNNAFWQHGPEEWTPVLDDADLEDGQTTKVDVGEATVLLHRQNGYVYAISSRCSHAGGPLEEGDVDPKNLCVTCPWHQSVFRLTDGTVAHGPATIPQANYEARVNEDKIEVRLAN